MLRLAALALLALCACKEQTKVELYVDGFQPENVRFELEDLGALDRAAIDALKKRPDVDGVLALPDGSCNGPCRVALVSVFVHNMQPGAEKEPAPVVRLKSPTNRDQRHPIAFRGGAIDKGRVGRIRWAVEMWPEEKALTATLSSSVELIDNPTAPPPAPPVPPTPVPDPAPKGTP